MTALNKPHIVDLPRRAVVEVTGRDRLRFLHGMCTNEIKKLTPGQGARAAVVSRQGKMLGLVHALVLESGVRLFTDRDNVPALLAALQRYIIADDVAFKPLEDPVSVVFGPGARALLQVPELPDGHGLLRDGLAIVRDRMLHEEAYEIAGPGPAATAPLEAWDSARIAAGIPRWGVDMGPDLLPMEAGLEPVAISYSKGCYIGQEVIQRVKTYSEPPRMLVSLAFDGAAVPSAGAALTADGAEAGTVTSTSGTAGLAVVRKEYKAPGTRLTAAPGMGATVRELPWQTRLTKT